MQPTAPSLRPLSAEHRRFAAPLFAALVGLLAIAGHETRPGALVLIPAICTVLLGSLAAAPHRLVLAMLGALEALVTAAGGLLLPASIAFAPLAVLGALQGLHSPLRAAGGAAGFAVAALWLSGSALSGYDLVAWTTAYACLAASAAVLQAQARASMRNVSAFGHELRTPLTNILQNAQMGLRTSPSAAHREYLDNIALAARHMDMLLSNVLDFLRLTTGSYVANASDVDITHMVDDLARLVEPLRAGQRVRLHALSHGPLVQFCTNADALRVSLVNLLSNAIKFTQDGRVAIVTATFATASGYRLRVRVVDEGKGVAPALRARLFSEFTTGEPWNRVQRGTGLGLALVRELARRQGGDVFYRPREEGGSEFGFEIPVQPPDSAELLQAAPGSFLLVSADEELAAALRGRARRLELVPDLDALKGIATARRDAGVVAILDARHLTTPIDRAALELNRISPMPLFAIADPVEGLESIEIGLALSGFSSLFNAREGPALVAEAISRAATSLIPEADGEAASMELRAWFSGRVLVVEDDPMQLRYLMLTLEHCGIVAIGVSSLAEARRAMLVTKDLRLLIVDYNLPDGTAAEMIAEIRQGERASERPFRLPIAVITAQERLVAIRELAGVDLDWFQSKPITDPLRFVRMALKRLEGQETDREPAVTVDRAPGAGAKLSALLAPDFALAASEALANILADSKEARWDRVYRHVHKLKGLAALMNETRLQGLCAELRRESPRPPDAAAWLKSLENEVDDAVDRAGASVVRARM
jgi:signal transduction histidine kinase/CheY-like chemotaxis protein